MASGARAVWTGAIAFGIATVPVKAYVTASGRDIETHKIHQHDDGKASRVKQQWLCISEDAVVENADLSRGYEYDDEIIVLTDEDLAQVPVASKSLMEITSIAPAAAIAPVFYERSFSLDADGTARRGLALLLQLLTDRDLVAVGKVTMGSREQLCVLRPMGGTLLMSTLFWADEVRIDPALPMPDVALTEAELTMGGALVDMLAAPFDHQAYVDDFRTGVWDLLTAKAAGETIEMADAPPAREPIDLAAALRASVERKRAELAPPARARTRKPAATPARAKKKSA